MSTTLTKGLDVYGIYMGMPMKMTMAVLSRRKHKDSEKGPSPHPAWRGRA